MKGLIVTESTDKHKLEVELFILRKLNQLAYDSKNKIIRESVKTTEELVPEYIKMAHPDADDVDKKEAARLERNATRNIINCLNKWKCVLNGAIDFYSYDEDKRKKGWAYKPGAGLNLPDFSVEKAFSLLLVEQFLDDYYPKHMKESLSSLFNNAKLVLENTMESQETNSIEKTSIVNQRNWIDKIRHVPLGYSLIPTVQGKGGTSDEIIYTALLEEYQIHCRYRNLKDEDYLRTLHPLGIVLRADRSFLIAVDSYSKSKEPKTFFLNRFSEVTSLKSQNKKVVVPEGFSLDRFIKEGDFYWKIKRDQVPETLELKVFDNELKNVLEETRFNECQEITQVGSRQWKLTATIIDTKEIRWMLLSFGLKVEVIEPEQIRDFIKESISGMHKIYNGC